MAKWMLPIFIFCNLYAYEFTQDYQQGFYWQTTPVHFSVVNPDSSITPLLHPSVRTILKQEVDTAVNAWHSGLGEILWNVSPIVLSSAVSGTNLVRWSNDIEGETGFNSSSTLAVTLRYINGPFYVRSEIILNANHPTLRNQYALRSTLIHEFGHTYGLGHSGDYNAIMYYSYTGSVSLGSDDVNGMRAILDDTNQKQLIGYISPLAFEQSGKDVNPMACATISLQEGSDLGGGSSNSIISLAFGLLLAMFMNVLRRKRFPVKIRA